MRPWSIPSRGLTSYIHSERLDDANSQPHRSSGHGDRRAHVAARRSEAPTCRPPCRCGCATARAPGPAGSLLRLTCGGGEGLFSGAHRADARRRRGGEGRGHTELSLISSIRRELVLDGPSVCVRMRCIAVCLDGSPPAYHMQRGSGSGSQSWIVFLQVTS